MANPFTTETPDMINIASGEIATPEIQCDLSSAKQKGKDKFSQFVESKLLTQEPDVFSKISQTKLRTFSTSRRPSKDKRQSRNTVDLRNDTKFLVRIFAMATSRQINTES